MRSRKVLTGVALAIAITIGHADTSSAITPTRSEINRGASTALKQLLASSSAAKSLNAKAKGVLIFPKILKAGFMVGAQGGDGVLRKGGKAVAYYRSLAGSYGFQAGAQSFSYVLFLMTSTAVDYLDTSGGWEIGSGPSLVVVDKGMAKSFSTTTAKKDVYAFIFGQKGLMGGLGLQGSKITRINPH
jgi:lipid-binding SYLF domain-containing protein